MRAFRLAAALLCAAALAGCGAPDRPRLVVAAAASLQSALEDCAAAFPAATVRLSFAGSDQLAAQIRQGVRPDVFVAANNRLPEALHREGLVGAPVVFAGNELVLAVPAGSARVRSPADAARRGRRLAMGSASVPVGDYARRALRELPASEREGILRNVASVEPDVKGVVAKLVHRAVDAGFVFRSDVVASGGRLRPVPLPPAARPPVVYAAALVAGGREPGLARAYVDGLLRGACARSLRRVGFRPPAR